MFALLAEQKATDALQASLLSCLLLVAAGGILLLLVLVVVRRVTLGAGGASANIPIRRAKETPKGAGIDAWKEAGRRVELEKVKEKDDESGGDGGERETNDG